jgi:hypothetical protein
MVAAVLTRGVTQKNPQRADARRVHERGYSAAMRGDHHRSMDVIDRPAFEGYLRLLAEVGGAALGLWLLIAALGLATGTAAVDGGSVLPFLLAVATLMAPSLLYPEIRRWPYRHLSSAQRLGLDDRERPR